MQKPAATNKSSHIDTTTAFVSHMFDQFLKKIMIKWTTLILIYFKTQTR